MPGSSKWEHVVIPYFFHSQTAGRSREGSYPAIAGVEDAGNVRRFQLAPPDSDEQPHGIADHLVEAGVCGILNFAGARIHVPEKVVVEYVDFFHYLYALAFSITGSEHRSK